MNVFKRGRKAKENPVGDGQGMNSGFKSLKRKQKNAPQPPTEFNLATALPDTNDFRTSLILPGMSARFSLLREQNDPSTKIGKAADDSVLFPKRASRMNLFKHNPLTDIAEVESVYSFKPPFAEDERSQSFSDGYASDDGAAQMSRSVPSEGNNLFGGRQKLYRIPANSSNKNSSDGSSAAVGGRHIYKNDISASLFRDSSRSRNEFSDDPARQSEDSPDVDDADPINSPSNPFSKNRGTTSSTASGPSNGRTSTAATSVGSESPAVGHNVNAISILSKISDQSNAASDKSTHSKRVYTPTDQATSGVLKAQDTLDNNQQSWVRPPTKWPQRLSQSRSATNLAERYSQSTHSVATSTSRTISPSVATSPIKGHGQNLARDEGRSPSPRYRAVSPTAALVGETETTSTLNEMVEPNDRGKATAMGFFNKPRQQYDEQQFSQRQVQMHEGRMSPFSNREQQASPADSRTSPEPITSIIGGSLPSSISAKTPEKNDQIAHMSGTFNRVPSDSPPDDVSSSQSSPTPPSSSDRPRRPSTTAAKPNVKSRVESLIKRQNAQLIALEAEMMAPGPHVDSSVQESLASSTNDYKGTFFDMQDEDADESDAEKPLNNDRKRTSRPQPSEVHPALRDGLNDFVFDDMAPSPKITIPKLPFSDISDHSNTDDSPVTTPLATPSEEKHQDSPTLPAPGLGLSGLVKHLRNDSDKSSVYPQSSPKLSQDYFRDSTRKGSTASTAMLSDAPGRVRSDPWELENANETSDTQHASESDDPTTAMAIRAQKMRDHAAEMRTQTNNKLRKILGDDAPNSLPMESPSRPWQDDMRSFHHRNGSSLTQKSRQEFDDEVAERAKRVHRNLKTDIRTRAPATRIEDPLPSPDFQPQPIPDRRNRPIRPHLDQVFEHQPKAMKMLGLQGPLPRQRGPPPGSREEMWREEEERMLQDFGRRPKQRSPPRDDESFGRPARPGHGPAMRNGSEDEFERSRQRSATPNSGQRNRSNSETANRSRSRTAMYRDGEERVPSRTGHSYGRPPYDPRMPPDERYFRAPSRGPNDQRMYERSASALSNRARSNSRAATPGLYDRPLASASMSNPNLSFGPPRPSPRIPSNQSPVISPRPPQSAFDSSSPTPSASNSPTNPQHQLSSTGRTTPTTNGGRITPSVTSGTAIGGRKKSITKNMISEPSFVSTTYSVPLVGLPSAQASENDASPPIPTRNPGRRRAPTITAPTTSMTNRVVPPQNPFQFLRADLRPHPKRDVSSPLPTSPDRQVFFHASSGELQGVNSLPSPAMAATMSDDNAVVQKAPRLRNKLRKVSSEGGSMASRARNQKMLDEFTSERTRSPAVPNFSFKHGGMI